MLAKFNEANPWQSSSGSSSDEDNENEDEDEEDEDMESEGSLLFKSDHEFSPESDLEKDQESEPLRRARTAQKGKFSVKKEIQYKFYIIFVTFKCNFTALILQLKLMLKKPRMNMLVKSVGKLIIPNGFYCAILATRVGTVRVLGQLLCLYLKAIGSVRRVSM